MINDHEGHTDGIAAVCGKIMDDTLMQAQLSMTTEDMKNHLHAIYTNLCADTTFSARHRGAVSALIELAYNIGISKFTDDNWS